MPTYAYACTACDHRFETVQSFTDDALTECPQCEGRLRKLFNSVGVVFKGSGFYRTDSRPKESSESIGSTTSTTSGSGASGSGASSTSSSSESSSSGSSGSAGTVKAGATSSTSSSSPATS